MMPWPRDRDLNRPHWTAAVQLPPSRAADDRKVTAMAMNTKPHGPVANVLVYWLPLGAGGHVVRLNGRLYEVVMALWERRPRADLYHSALEVVLGENRYVIEMAPVWSLPDPDRGALVYGPVGLRWLGRFATFRYEVRCWNGGRIPDLAEAVDSPVEVDTDTARTRRLLDLVAQAPPLVWGRDELHTNDMWNSNSLISWLLARSGHDTATLRPPPAGRAPGWRAGLVLAARQQPHLEPVR
jgi:hypothetical protein